MKTTIIGTGYIALTTGTCLAETGSTVTCVDFDQNKTDHLNNGTINIDEPSLEYFMKRNIKKGRLQFSSNLEQSINESEVIFIALETETGNDGEANLASLYEAAEQIGQKLTHYALIATRSAVPVGTTYKIKEIIQKELNKRNSDIEFDVASNPEFLRAGNAIEDFLKPDRIILGTENSRAGKVLSNLYKSFILSSHPVIFMDIISAELTRYALVSMSTNNIRFTDELHELCENVGANFNAVYHGISADNTLNLKNTGQKAFQTAHMN